MSNSAIEIKNLGKLYTLGRQQSTSLRESINTAVKRIISPNVKDEFWALRDINLNILQGESVGIIGRNGAGKSTLLKIISRITQPTEGRVEITGRISSLLEVGTGFHPELTGAENIYLNGMILGMTRREIDSKYNDIVAFSGVERFIDTAVKHYSSGMQVRLAFSVAAHLEPEVLLIDEVLAVGDAEFQKKCLGKMQDVATDGRTVVFVSHNLGAVRSFCKRTAVIEGGELVFFGDTSDAIVKYLNLGALEEDLSKIERRVGDNQFRFSKVEFLDFSNNSVGSILSGQDLRIRIYYQSKEKMDDTRIRLQVVSPDGYTLFSCDNFISGGKLRTQKGAGYIEVDIPDLPLNIGKYQLNLICFLVRDVKDELFHVSPFQVIAGNFYPTGKLPGVGQGLLIRHTWRDSN